MKNNPYLSGTCILVFGGLDATAEVYLPKTTFSELFINYIYWTTSYLHLLGQKIKSVRVDWAQAKLACHIRTLSGIGAFAASSPSFFFSSSAIATATCEAGPRQTGRCKTSVHSASTSRAVCVQKSPRNSINLKARFSTDFSVRSTSKEG